MMNARRFEGTDPEALQEHLRAITSGLRLRPLPGAGPFRAHSLLLNVGDVRAWRNTYVRPFQLSALAENDALVLCLPIRGGMQVSGAQTHTVVEGRLLSFIPAEAESPEMMTDAKTDNLAIPRDVLDVRLAQLLDHTPSGRLRFHAEVDATEGGGAAVRSVVHGLLHAADRPPHRSSSTLKTLSTALIDLVLESLPHTYTEALHRPPVRIGPRQVRRAIAYIRDQPMPVLTTEELADICGVSVRSLQYTFRQFVGMAPAEYWRKVRLELALEQLKRSPPGSLSRVASEWGFTNVTRFRTLAGLPYQAASRERSTIRRA